MEQVGTALTALNTWNTNMQLNAVAPTGPGAELLAQEPDAWFDEVFGPAQRANAFLWGRWQRGVESRLRGAVGRAHVNASIAAMLVEALRRELATLLERAASVGQVKMSGRAIGTAFVIDPGRVLTCWHVLSKASLADVTVTFPTYAADGTPGPTREFRPKDTRDLARIHDRDEDWRVIELAETPEHRAPRPIPWSVSLLREGGDALLIDYPNGGPQQVATDYGRVRAAGNAKDDIRLEHTLTVSRGSSGAPLFDRRWRALGMQQRVGPSDPENPARALYAAGIRIDAITRRGQEVATQIGPGDIHLLQRFDPAPATMPTVERGRMFGYANEERWFTFSESDALRVPEAKTFLPLDASTPEADRFVRLWFAPDPSQDFLDSEFDPVANQKFRDALPAHGYAPLECALNPLGGWQGDGDVAFALWQGSYDDAADTITAAHAGYVTLVGDKQHWLLFTQDDPQATPPQVKFEWVKASNAATKGTLWFRDLPGGLPQALPPFDYVRCEPYPLPHP